MINLLVVCVTVYEAKFSRQSVSNIFVIRLCQYTCAERSKSEIQYDTN